MKNSKVTAAHKFYCDDYRLTLGNFDGVGWILAWWSRTQQKYHWILRLNQIWEKKIGYNCMLILTKFRHGSTFPQILSEILLLIYQQHNRSMFLNMLPTLSKQRLMILVRANTITALHLPTLMNTATDTCTCSL